MQMQCLTCEQSEESARPDGHLSRYHYSQSAVRLALARRQSGQRTSCGDATVRLRERPGAVGPASQGASAMRRSVVGPGSPDAGETVGDARADSASPKRTGAAALSRGGAQNADFTTPPSTRSAAPVVADDRGLAT